MIEFNPEPWFKTYIYLKEKLRTKDKNNYGKNFSKFINNFVFGKTMENVRKSRNIEPVDDKRQAKKLSSVRA